MDAVQAVAVLSLLLMIRRRNDNFRLRIRTILYCLLIERRQDIQSWFLLKRLARRQRLGRRARRAWVWPRPQNYFEELLLNREIDHQWKEHFRVNRDTFRFICQTLAIDIQKQDTQFRDAIPVPKRVATALWRLGTKECFRSVGNNFGLGKATAKIVSNDVVHALVNRYDDFVKFPETEQETRATINKFQQLGNFPQVMGAIDGTYIQIIATKEDKDDFYFRKGYPAVILQGTVGADMKFIDVCTGFPCSLHDAQVFRLSNLYARAVNNEILTSPVRNINGVQVGPQLLGDGAYPVKAWLMKPFPRIGNLTRSQRKYNRELSKLRVKVEHAFGHLKGRWRCLRKGELYESIEIIPYTVIACCILHNICVEMNDDFECSDDSDSDDNDTDDDRDNAGNMVCDAIRQFLI